MCGVCAPRRRPSAIPAVNTSASLTPGRDASSIAWAIASPIAATCRTSASSSSELRMIRRSRLNHTGLNVACGNCSVRGPYSACGRTGTMCHGGYGSRPITPTVPRRSPCSVSSWATWAGSLPTRMLAGAIHSASPRLRASMLSSMLIGDHANCVGSSSPAKNITIDPGRSLVKYTSGANGATGAHSCSPKTRSASAPSARIRSWAIAQRRSRSARE